MANEHDRKEQQPSARKPVNPGAPGAESMEELQRGRRGGLFHRFGARFQEAIETGRGGGSDDFEDLDEPQEESSLRPVQAPPVRSAANDEAVRQSRETRAVVRTVIPDGVVINGSLTSAADAEISGKIEGDVTVEGRLYLGPTALIAGNVRAALCKVEGMVEGKVECSQDLEIGESGRLNADAVAARKITLAGQVTGNVSTGGLLRLLATARIAGDIRARSIVIEEGAFFNGKCVMRPSGERQPQTSDT